MKTNPWFSTERQDDVNTKVFHHNNTSCAAGEAIEKNHHRYGTDNRPLCKKCLQLDEAGR